MYVVDFVEVSTVGLETSPVAPALAGLRANEARYFRNKYEHVFTVESAADAAPTVDWVRGILRDERDLVIASPPLEATEFEVDGVHWAYVFYESGLDQCALHDRGGRKASRGLQTLRRDGRTGRIGRPLQVRASEVEAGGHHPGFLLRDQG